MKKKLPMDLDGKVPNEFAVTKTKDQFISTRLRTMCRDGFEAAAPKLLALALGEIENSNPAVQIRAIDLLARYGIGRNPSLFVDNAEVLLTFADVTNRVMNDEEKYLHWCDQVSKTFDSEAH